MTHQMPVIITGVILAHEAGRALARRLRSIRIDITVQQGDGGEGGAGPPGKA